MSLLAPSPQEPITVHEDLQYSEVARQPRRNRLDLYLPRVAPSLEVETEVVRPPIVMFVHGGTWTGGKKDGFGLLGSTLAHHGYACAVINTQLFPFAKPDAMVVDCANALGFLRRNAEAYGFDGDQLFVMGHSSGAHLCGWLALDDRLLQAAGVPQKALRGSILFSGVYEIRPRHIALDAVFGEDAAFRTLASPVLHVDGGDAPVFLAWGQRDLPGLSLCARMLRDRLQLANVPVVANQYADCDHANYVFEIGTRFDRITPDVLRFLKDPKKAVAAPADKPRRAMLWVATCTQERAVGVALQKALGAHGVEVLVQDFFGVTGPAVAAAFRELRAQRVQQQAISPSYVGGMGVGGLAAAAAPLTGVEDGLLGRIVAATSLGGGSLSAFSKRTVLEDTSWLQAARLLSLFGDQDSKTQVDEANQRTASLLRSGFDAHAIQLANTSAEAALLAVEADDDLLVPLLLAFIYP